MAQRVLSIDIREDVVCGVLLSLGSSGTTIASCSISAVADGAIEESVAEVVSHLDYNGEPCRISLGAENFYFRNLTFPFSDKRKIEKIIAIELEESIAVDMGDVLVDSLVTGKKGDESTVVAAMLERELLQTKLNSLSELQIDPEIVAVSGVQAALLLSRNRPGEDFILLDAGCRRVTMFVMVQSRMRLIRTMVFDDGSRANFSMDKNSQLVSAKKPEKIEETLKTMCREIRHTLYALEDINPSLPIYLTGPLAGVRGSDQLIGKILGSEVTVCDFVGSSIGISQESGLWRADIMSSALALGVRAGKKQAGFNFRKQEFARKVSFQKYTKLMPRLGIPAALLLVIALGFLWNDYSLRQKNLESLRKQGEDIFSATLPEVSRIVDPVQQLKIEIREMKKGMLGEATTQADLKVLDLMAELSVRIPKSINVHFIRMVADQNGILLRGLTDNFNSVDNLKKVLDQSDYFESVIINSANLATNSAGIRFELKLQLNRG